MGYKVEVVRKKIIHTLILVCFLTTSISPAFAQEKSPIALDPAIFTDMDPDKFMQRPDNLTPEEQAEMKKFLKLPTQTVLETLFLLKNLYYKVQMKEAQYGTDAVTKILSKRKDSESINYEWESVGKAEPLVINTARGPLFFTKVRHNALKMSMLFIDKSQIDIEFLLESERMIKNGTTKLDPTLQGLSQKQIKKELDHRMYILKQMKTLYAKMLMSEWGPKLQYVPLAEQIEKANNPPPDTSPDELQSRVSQIMNDPVSELKDKSWFKELASKSFTTWTDLAKQEEKLANTTPGNETLMLVMFDSSQISDGAIKTEQGTISPGNLSTIRKGSRYSLGYWKKWWKSIYERPAYGEPVWNNNKGIKKLKVLFTGDYLIGLGFGVGLGALSTATAALFPSSLPHGLTPVDVGTISFAYSLFFGVFGKTWANFVYRGNEFLRFIKNWTPGIAQSYTYNIVSHETLSLLGTSGLNSAALKTHGDILINQSIKTVTKTSLQEIPRTRSKTGEAEGTLKIPYYKVVLPWKHNMKFMEVEAVETTVDTLKLVKWIRNQFTIDDSPLRWEDKFILKFHRDWKITIPWLVRHEYETYIPRQNFENQSPQFVTTPVGLLSRFGYTIGPVPVGHLLYMILGPIGEVRQIRYKRQYADLLARNYGEDDATTKKWRAILKDEVTAWNNLRIGKWAKIEFYRDPSPLPRTKTYFGYRSEVIDREEMIRETLYGRPDDKPKPSFSIPNGTQFFGYYLKTVPIQVWETAKELSQWIARKTAYHTFEVYQSIEKDFEAQRSQRLQSEAAQDRWKQMMTVQTADGHPHPRQVKQAAKIMSCLQFFR